MLLMKYSPLQSYAISLKGFCMASNSKPLVRGWAGTSVAQQHRPASAGATQAHSSINTWEPSAGVSPHQTITPTCTR